MSEPAQKKPTQDAPRFAWVRIWDLPTRLFHWALVICVCTTWYIGDNRSFDNITWHFYLGYAIGGLLAFRILWGLIGPGNVRLAGLVHGPGAVLRYAAGMFKRSPSGTPGHNPIGSWSVIAMLVSLIVQVVTGLFAYDDGLFEGGPFSESVPETVMLQMNAIHETNANILLILVGLHVAAALFYLFWKRENLISAMITGRKLVRQRNENEQA